MDISFDSQGRILSCSLVAGVIGGDNVLTIPDDQVPDDLLATLASDKYLVRKGRIVENEAYETRAPGAIDKMIADVLGFGAIEEPQEGRKKSKKG